MKNILFFLALIIGVNGFSQRGKARLTNTDLDTIQMSKAQIEAIFKRSKNQGVNQVNRVMWSTDRVINKVTRKGDRAGNLTTVQVRLSRLNNALMTITRLPNGSYTGRILKLDNSVSYTLRNFVFYKDTLPAVLNAPIGLNEHSYKPYQVTTRAQDSINIVNNGYFVLFYDFDGQYVTGTSWNTSGDINAAPSNANNPTDIDYCVTMGKEIYAPFRVVITSDSTMYFLAPLGKRQRIIQTASCEWYSCSFGGVSLVNATYQGDETPSWSFDIAGNTRTKAITLAHEGGHDLGLRHQGISGGSQYNSGYGGTDETSLGPVMGNPFTRNMIQWFNGNQENYAGVKQLDIDQMIAERTLGSLRVVAPGFTSGDVGKTWYSARALKKDISAIGLLGVHDSDYYKFELVNPQQVVLNLVPRNMGANNLNATVDLKMHLRDKDRNFIVASSNTTTLDAVLSIWLRPGVYYIAVRPDEANTNNPNTPSTYGFMGHYTLSLTY